MQGPKESSILSKRLILEYLITLKHGKTQALISLLPKRVDDSRYMDLSHQSSA